MLGGESGRIAVPAGRYRMLAGEGANLPHHARIGAKLREGENQYAGHDYTPLGVLQGELSWLERLLGTVAGASERRPTLTKKLARLGETPVRLESGMSDLPAPAY